MAKIFIVEDEMMIRESLMMILEELGHDISGSCDNADMALQQIIDSDAEIVLLDIGLPGKNNGISLAGQISSKLQLPYIFITSFQDKETIAEAVETHPVTYLTKPVKSGDLQAAIEMALQYVQISVTEKSVDGLTDDIFVKVGDKLSKVEISSILWLCASDSNYCDLVLKDGKTVSVRSSLTKMLGQLPSAQFVQIHRQYAINLKALEHIHTADQTVYISGTALPLGRAYKEAFMKRIERL